MDLESRHALLDALCDCFDEELERQENAGAIVLAQCQAARAHDLEALEARTAALQAVVEEAAAAEKHRLRLLRKVVAEYELDEAHQTLSALVDAVEEPWRTRMAEFQHRMRAVLSDTQRAAREGRRYMRRSLKVVDDALALVQPLSKAPSGYDESGERQNRAGRFPAVIDRRG